MFAAISPKTWSRTCAMLRRVSATRTRYIVSGAAHDAADMSRIAPTAKVLVPCAGGISHNELQSARPERLAAGCDVLLHAVLRRAEARAAPELPR